MSLILHLYSCALDQFDEDSRVLYQEQHLRPNAQCHCEAVAFVTTKEANDELAIDVIRFFTIRHQTLAHVDPFFG